MIIFQIIYYLQKPQSNVIVQRRVSVLQFSVILSHAYARWKGTGELCPNFTLKFTKNFPRQIWKIFSGFIYLRPLYRNMILIWLDTQWERLWHFWTTVMSVQCLLCSSRDLNCLIQWLFWCCNHQICIFR